MSETVSYVKVKIIFGEWGFKILFNSQGHMKKSLCLDAKPADHQVTEDHL